MRLDVKDWIILILMLYTFIQQLIFILTVQKMVNKLMSKNFHDYMFSKNVEKTMSDGQGQASLDQTMRHEHVLAEDLGPLNEFAGMP